MDKEEHQSTRVLLRFHERIDYVLQLIFFDPAHLTDEIRQSKNLLAFYRIFVLSSSEPIDLKDQLGEIDGQNIIGNNRNLILHYNSAIDSLCINYVMAKNFEEFENLNQEAIVLNQDTCFDCVNWFDRTFGEFERMESIEIHRFDFFNGSRYFNVGHHLYNVMNYYHLLLNNSHLNMTWKNINNFTDRTNQLSTLKRRKVFN